MDEPRQHYNKDFCDHLLSPALLYTQCKFMRLPIPYARQSAFHSASVLLLSRQGNFTATLWVKADRLRVGFEGGRILAQVLSVAACLLLPFPSLQDPV